MNQDNLKTIIEQVLREMNIQSDSPSVVSATIPPAAADGVCGEPAPDGGWIPDITEIDIRNNIWWIIPNMAKNMRRSKRMRLPPWDRQSRSQV